MWFSAPSRQATNHQSITPSINRSSRFSHHSYIDSHLPCSTVQLNFDDDKKQRDRNFGWTYFATVWSIAKIQFRSNHRNQFHDIWNIPVVPVRLAPSISHAQNPLLHRNEPHHLTLDLLLDHLNRQLIPIWLILKPGKCWYYIHVWVINFAMVLDDWCGTTLCYVYSTHGYRLHFRWGVFVVGIMLLVTDTHDTMYISMLIVWWWPRIVIKKIGKLSSTYIFNQTFATLKLAFSSRQPLSQYGAKNIKNKHKQDN